MKMKWLILLPLFLLVLLISFSTPPEGTVTINLNSTQVWWNDSIYAFGNAKYSTGSPIQGEVYLKIDNKKFSCGTTDENGDWNCTFNAPIEIGEYEVEVNVTNSTGYSFLNSTLFKVSPFYGKKALRKSNKIVLEIPTLLQDMSGKITKVLLKLYVWK